MEQVFKTDNGGLWVGDDTDGTKARALGWYVVSCCKEGPNGHRSVLGYKTPAAPKGPDYNFVLQGKHLALNLIDPDDPAFVNDKAVDAALAFIKKHIEEGKVLVHCNQGHSRSPSIALLFLRMIGDLPPRFQEGFKIFKGIYHKYDPGLGMRHYTKTKYNEFK